MWSFQLRFQTSLSQAHLPAPRGCTLQIASRILLDPRKGELLTSRTQIRLCSSDMSAPWRQKSMNLAFCPYDQKCQWQGDRKNFAKHLLPQCHNLWRQSHARRGIICQGWWSLTYLFTACAAVNPLEPKAGGSLTSQSGLGRSRWFHQEVHGLFRRSEYSSLTVNKANGMTTIRNAKVKGIICDSITRFGTSECC